MEVTFTTFVITTLSSNPATNSNPKARRTISASSSSSSSSSSNNNRSIEIRVCVNRTCNKQGSRTILDVLASIAPPHVSVNSCGCLGRCGAGPNVAVVPNGTVVGHMGTAARAARVMEEVCGDGFDGGRSLEALALRRKAEEEIEIGNFDEAEQLLSKAIKLKPLGGLHFIYKSRSAARLGKGDNQGALEDAVEACFISPNFPQGYICQGDAFLAMEDFASAEKAYSYALQIDPSIRRSKSFKEDRRPVNVCSCNALISMFARIEYNVLGREMFDHMNEKDTISWNSMINGYALCGSMVIARSLFDQMPLKDNFSWRMWFY